MMSDKNATPTISESTPVSAAIGGEKDLFAINSDIKKKKEILEAYIKEKEDLGLEKWYNPTEDVEVGINKDNKILQINFKKEADSFCVILGHDEENKERQLIFYNSGYSPKVINNKDKKVELLDYLIEKIPELKHKLPEAAGVGDSLTPVPQYKFLPEAAGVGDSLRLPVQVQSRSNQNPNSTLTAVGVVSVLRNVGRKIAQCFGSRE